MLLIGHLYWIVWSSFSDKMMYISISRDPLYTLSCYLCNIRCCCWSTASWGHIFKGRYYSIILSDIDQDGSLVLVFLSLLLVKSALKTTNKGSKTFYLYTYIQWNLSKTDTP